MTDLPADILQRYKKLAQQRNWPPEIEAAFLRTVARYRDIDEGPAPRSYYEGTEEDMSCPGTRWLFETAVADGAVIAVKQIEVYADGVARCYCWRQLEDANGFLTDQPIRPEDGLHAISRDTFYDLWNNSWP